MGILELADRSWRKLMYPVLVFSHVAYMYYNWMYEFWCEVHRKVLNIYDKYNYPF